MDRQNRRRGTSWRVAGIAVALLGLAAALPAQAQWKWRDASGRVTASDLPPPREIPEKDILQRPNQVVRPAAAPAAPASGPAPGGLAASPAASAAPTKGDKELEARKRAADQQAADKRKADEEKVAATRAENCRRARAHLATVESGQRLVRTNAKGEREVMDDRARAEEAQRAREVISSDCKS